MPNALGILVNLPHAVKRDSMDLALGIGKMKGFGAFQWKGYFLQWNQNDAVFGPIVIS
jgi:hypothetical protein